jgi:hypothetical protein
VGSPAVASSSFYTLPTSPAITSLVAAGLSLHSDKLLEGSTITVVFQKPTNMPNASGLLSWSANGKPFTLSANFVSAWASPTRLVYTLSTAISDDLPVVGVLTASINATSNICAPGLWGNFSVPAAGPSGKLLAGSFMAYSAMGSLRSSLSTITVNEVTPGTNGASPTRKQGGCFNVRRKEIGAVCIDKRGFNGPGIILNTLHFSDFFVSFRNICSDYFC